MATPNPSPTRKFMRLRESFCTTFPWNHQNLARDGFRKWAREKYESPININAHHWRPMRDGKPVPREMVEAFSVYISEQHILPNNQCLLSVIAETCGPPATADAEAPRRPRMVEMLGWSKLYTQMMASFNIADLARCENEADLMLAAQVVMECVGWHEKRLSGGPAIAYAESEMKRTLEEYAEALRMCWKANEHAVVFATQKRGGAVERIGVSVCTAVTEDFYRRFRSGQAVESRLDAVDVVPQSQYVMINAYAENVAIDLKQNKVARTLSQSRTSLYQLASLFLPVQHDAWQPHIVSFAGTAESDKRLRTYGFSPTGATLPDVGKAIMEFAPPDRSKPGMSYLKALAEYLPMKALIQIFQAYIETQRVLLE